MSFVALTTFISMGPYYFQNGNHSLPSNSTVSGYKYLSFIYQGATKNRSGDNLIASLVLANNPLSMNYAQEAIENKYQLDIATYLMNEDFTDKKDTRPLTHEIWLASSLSYDPETIEIILSSAIDAVGANAPNRVLTRDMVGHLPVTGTIQNR